MYSNKNMKVSGERKIGIPKLRWSDYTKIHEGERSTERRSKRPKNVDNKTYIIIYILTEVRLFLSEHRAMRSIHITLTGDPAGPMPADTHLFQVFFES